MMPQMLCCPLDGFYVSKLTKCLNSSYYLSHQPTREQIKQARLDFNITDFVSLPQDLQKLWSNVPPDLKSLKTYLSPFDEFLKEQAKAGDFVLIQGELGATYTMINTAKSLELNPIYATTKRMVKEELINDKIIKTSVFEHVLFRDYE